MDSYADYQLSTPFWEFRYVKTTEPEEAVKKAEAFYSLLGVSGTKVLGRTEVDFEITFYSLLGVSIQ